MDTNVDKRSEGRANVFLSATLVTGTASIPVRIRNFSPRGALIEATSFPDIGTRVGLVRGSLNVQGELVWQMQRMAGVNFTDVIDVERWVQRVGHSGQDRVDGVVAALRRAEPVPPELSGKTETHSLASISAALDQLCDRLAGAPNMSVELGEELVKLDTIAQSLRHLATGSKV